jgi:hypothetical protein
MLTMLKKSARRVFLTAVVTILLIVGSVSALANTLEYLGTDENIGEQYYMGCGSSSGDYIMVYNPATGQRTFYPTQCSQLSQ